MNKRTNQMQLVACIFYFPIRDSDQKAKRLFGNALIRIFSLKPCMSHHCQRRGPEPMYLFLKTKTHNVSILHNVSLMTYYHVYDRCYIVIYWIIYYYKKTMCFLLPTVVLTVSVSHHIADYLLHIFVWLFCIFLGKGHGKDLFLFFGLLTSSFYIRWRIVIKCNS